MIDFYNCLNDGEEYANISCTLPVYFHIYDTFGSNDFELHFVKKVNKSYEDNEELNKLYKQKSKLNKQIIELEQKIEHGK